MGENIEGHTSNEVFTVGIYREILKLNKGKNTQLAKSFITSPNRIMQETDKYMEGNSISLVIGMQIKTITRYYYILTRMVEKQANKPDSIKCW